MSTRITAKVTRLSGISVLGKSYLEALCPFLGGPPPESSRRFLRLEAEIGKDTIADFDLRPRRPGMMSSARALHGPLFHRPEPLK